jgi:3-oxoacyl-[acyl-carrier-protein] synthase II
MPPGGCPGWASAVPAFDFSSGGSLSLRVLFPRPWQEKGSPRVVITGAGVVTAFGAGWKKNADGFRTGRTAFQPVSLFDTSKHRAKVAAEVTFNGDFPETRLRRPQLRRLDRASKLLLLAASEAWEQARWEASDGLPVVLGTTSGGMALGQDFYRQALAHPQTHFKQATRVVHYQCQRQALDLCDAFGFSGPLTLIANACASGTNSIGHAWELIRHGRAERVLTGGYDSLSELVFTGFDSLQALSTTQCRPFDHQRDGLALGEGAAVLALETLESAQRRGAVILGEIIGYGAATDAHHLTQPHPEGDAALASMNEATRVAGITPDQVGYINAHGTGTPLNDSAEALAINRWSGEAVSRMRVSSTKASIGHTLGAAGSIEAVICLMSLREQWLPPTSTLQTIDPACRFQLVTKPEEARVDCALSNSFGFGGANATVILRRWQ